MQNTTILTKILNIGKCTTEHKKIMSYKENFIPYFNLIFYKLNCFADTCSSQNSNTNCRGYFATSAIIHSILNDKNIKRDSYESSSLRTMSKLQPLFIQDVTGIHRQTFRNDRSHREDKFLLSNIYSQIRRLWVLRIDQGARP